MLWLHIGMPKTGTTAVQKFLSKNYAELRSAGLNYMVAGRKRPDGPGRVASSHNQIGFDLTKGGPNAVNYRNAINTEYAENEGATCIVSSEVFFSTRHKELAALYQDIPSKEKRILLYCRRYDDYFEAEYKQHSKNGKVKTGATQHIKARLAAMKENPERFNFSGRVSSISEAFTDVEIVPVIYDRKSLVNGNLVDDLLERVGAKCPSGLSTEINSNPSLSRIASEAFGIVSDVMGRHNSRRLRRLVDEEPALQRKHDVLEIDERNFVNEVLAKSDEEFRKKFFPERSSLFSERTPTDVMKSYRRDTPQDVEDMKAAMSQIFKLALETRPDVLRAPQTARAGKRRLKAVKS